MSLTNPLVVVVVVVSKLLAPLSQPMRSNTKPIITCSLTFTIFPALDAGYMYLRRFLIGSLGCLRLL